MTSSTSSRAMMFTPSNWQLGCSSLCMRRLTQYAAKIINCCFWLQTCLMKMFAWCAAGVLGMPISRDLPGLFMTWMMHAASWHDGSCQQGHPVNVSAGCAEMSLLSCQSLHLVPLGWSSFTRQTGIMTRGKQKQPLHQASYPVMGLRKSAA